MTKYVSLGAQCTTPTLFERLNVKSETLPFDWMISTPKFVYKIIKLLLINKKDINDIIDNHFFLCDKKAILQAPEHFTLNDNGNTLINTKYHVCFPHDTLSDKDKYVRRMNRLKQILLDQNIFIHFVYVSVSSQTSGNYTIDGYEPIQHLYKYINKINTIIKSVRCNYKISIFDINKPTNIISLDASHIAYYDIKEANNWANMLSDLIDVYSYVFL